MARRRLYLVRADGSPGAIALPANARSGPVSREPGARVLHVPDPHVSLRHGEWRRVDGTLELRDAGSRNGTRTECAGTLGQAWSPLAVGEWVEFGVERWILTDVPRPGPTEPAVRIRFDKSRKFVQCEVVVGVDRRVLPELRGQLIWVLHGDGQRDANGAYPPVAVEHVVAALYGRLSSGSANLRNLLRELRDSSAPESAWVRRPRSRGVLQLVVPETCVVDIEGAD